MDPSDAASFGLFDILSGTWKEDLISRCGLPPQILPQIVKAPGIFGRLARGWASDLGLPEGIPVIVPIGDNQASLCGSLSDPDTQIALTIGTGAQVSVVLSENPRELPGEGSTFEVRPYIDDRYIVVGASLGGGRTLAALSTALQDFLQLLGSSPRVDPVQIYSVLQSLAEPRADTTLVADPSFAGERHNPELRGSLTSITFENFTLGDIFAALSKGIVDSLRRMLPLEIYHGRQHVIGSGNAIRHSALMQRYIEQLFGVPLVVTPGGETTCAGVAFLAGRVL
jgi:sedoheptulokinase